MRASYRALCQALVDELKQYDTSSYVYKEARLALSKGKSSGAFKPGHVPSNTVLTPDDVRTMRQMYKEGWSYQTLAQKYGMSSAHISAIVRGKRWTTVKDLPPKRKSPANKFLFVEGNLPHNAVLNADNVREMRQLHASGWSYKELETKYGVSRRHIAAIIHRRRWKHVE